MLVLQMTLPLVRRKPDFTRCAYKDTDVFIEGEAEFIEGIRPNQWGIRTSHCVFICAEVGRKISQFNGWPITFVSTHCPGVTN
jgi:hypothetical protein